MKDNEWWRQATIYQIYPVSYQDTTGNGRGDLKGVIKRLPYIASLGVDGIWISPFFKSPMKDFGYDVSDYQTVDPSFGSLKDFENLVKKAHQLKLKVVIDQVLSHTSDQHPWFIKSKSDRNRKNNSKADWYVWADPNHDGTPPNNWLSIFGGSAWQWDTGREQYFLHNFLKEQPDLNFHNPRVQEAVLAVMKFWLDLGVDGFRLDTINFFFHSQSLKNNPSLKKQERGKFDNQVNPYTYQLHKYDKTQPEMIPFLEKLRKLLDRYPGSFTMGEVGDENSLKVIADYTRGQKRLHTCYGFDFLSGPYQADYFQEVINRTKKIVKDGWMIWAFSNHDVKRSISRWLDSKHLANRKYQVALSKQLITLLSSFKGASCIYQGEELGLPEADIPFEKLQDPYGIAMYPKFKGRDGCRTPMVWETGKLSGFSSGIKCNNEAWLPIPKEHAAVNVSRQERDEKSILNYYRKYLRFKRDNIRFFQGEIEISSDKNILTIVRKNSNDNLMIGYFNISSATEKLNINQLQRQLNLSKITLIEKSNDWESIVNSTKLICHYFMEGVNPKKDERETSIQPYGFIQLFLKAI